MFETRDLLNIRIKMLIFYFCKVSFLIYNKGPVPGPDFFLVKLVSFVMLPRLVSFQYHEDPRARFRPN